MMQLIAVEITMTPEWKDYEMHQDVSMQMKILQG
jgi:hypothetical protein